MRFLAKAGMRAVNVAAAWLLGLLCAACLLVAGTRGEPNIGVRFKPTGEWLSWPDKLPKISGRTLSFASDCDEACCKARCEVFGPK